MGIFSETKKIGNQSCIRKRYQTEFSVASIEIDIAYAGDRCVDITYKIYGLANHSLHSSGDIEIKVYIESLDRQETFFPLTKTIKHLEKKDQYYEIKTGGQFFRLPRTGNYNLIISVSELTTSHEYVERYVGNFGNKYFKHPREKLAEDIAKKIFDNSDSGLINAVERSFYEENRALVYSKLEELKKNEYEERKKQKQEEEKRIQEDLTQKKLEREEDARESAFQKNLKSISEDIDALELAVGKGIFNIQQLTILENHISILCENKSILNENNRNILQRKMKYLKVIFQDCEKLPDCKGSAKIRMGEILKMLDGLNKS